MASQGDAAPAVDGSAVQASYAAACALSNSIYAAAERFGRMAGKPGLLLGPGSVQAAAPNPGISPFILLWAAGTLLLAFYFVYCHMRSRRGYRESASTGASLLSKRGWAPQITQAGTGAGFRPDRFSAHLWHSVAGHSFAKESGLGGYTQAGLYPGTWKQRISVISTHWGNGCCGCGAFVCMV